MWYQATLLQADLWCEYDEMVTCSDASESGGAAATSEKLTWSGSSVVKQLSFPRNAAVSTGILVISVFNGIGGAFRLYDILGLAVMGRIAVEVYKPANRVCRSAWGKVDEFHDILDLTLSDVKSWADRYNRAVEVHLYAGFPCVHLSSVRAHRQNLQGPGSKLFWELLGWVTQVFSSFWKVKWCIENVASSI